MIERAKRASASPAEDPGETVYPAPRLRAAIVQLEAVHEECVPALVHLLRLNAVDPVVLLNERIKRLRPGLRSRFPELRNRVRFVPIEARADWTRLARRVSRIDPDLVVVNTFQSPGPVGWVAEWAPRWNVPILGVVHNVELLRGTEAAQRLVAAGRVGLLTLAPHVTAALMRTDPTLYARAATITSTFPRVPRVRPAHTDRKTVAITGSVNFASRDYRQVLDALPALKAQVGAETFRLTIIGGGADRVALQKQVAEAGLEEQFGFVELNEEGFVSGADYYAHLRSADFLLPLIPPDSASFRTLKITSAIPTATGVGVPPIVDRWTAAVYDVPALTYPRSEIGGALVRALAMNKDDHADLRRRLFMARDRDLARAERELDYALAAVGAAPDGHRAGDAGGQVPRR